MAGFEIFPVWAEHGDLKPLIKALRSDEPMPRQTRDGLAHFLSQIISFKLGREASWVSLTTCHPNRVQATWWTSLFS
jgi:hypothetical protein